MPNNSLRLKFHWISEWGHSYLAHPKMSRTIINELAVAGSPARSRTGYFIIFDKHLATFLPEPSPKWCSKGLADNSKAG
jgi:hypothetical protein